MPKFTVIRYRTLEDEWYNIEAENAEAAIDQVMEDDLPADHINDDDSGEFEAEEEESK